MWLNWSVRGNVTVHCSYLYFVFCPKIRELLILWFFNNRRQKELEAKLVEEETAKRIEELVAKRVAEELERRKDEIEAEVLRRVQEAKEKMEKEMMEELQRQKMAQLEEERKREVAISSSKPLSLLLHNDLFFNVNECDESDDYLSFLRYGEDERVSPFQKISSGFSFAVDLNHFALLHDYDFVASDYLTLYRLLVECLKNVRR